MPVKNIKRKTNDGLQGIIVGLTDEEKQALIKDGVGKSVSPCLNLLTEDQSNVRTSITEEEKINLENHLYNSVYYIDSSKGDASVYSIYFPEALSPAGGGVFSTFNAVFDEASNSATIVGISVYQLTVGEKSADGTYPLTIENAVNGTFGGGASVTIRRW